MPRIPQEQVDRVNAHVSLERLVAAKGVALGAQGENVIGACPLHESAEPTLVISIKENAWHCTSCGEKGGPVEWVMKTEGVSPRYAVELLRADAPLSPSLPTKTGRQVGSVPKKSTATKLPTVFDASAEDAVLLGQVVEFYHATLKETPEALAFLERLGLRSSEMVEHFRLGYANRTLAYRLPHKNRKLGAELRGRLQRLGILRETGHEHFNGAVVFPVMGEAGQVLDLYGRRVSSEAGVDLYLPDSRRGVWNLAAFQANTEIIVFASVIDALTFWCHGIRNVTASFGTELPSPDLLDALRRHEIRRILLAFRREEQGDQAAERWATHLTTEGIGSSRVLFPRGLRANEFALKASSPAEALANVLRQAQWMGKGKAPSAETPTESTPPSSSPAPTVPPSRSSGETVSAIMSPPTRETASVADPHKDEVVVHLGDRRWRIRGLARNTSPDQMRVNLFVSREGAGFHVDAVDLYSARQRAQYVAMASSELAVEDAVVKSDLGELLLKLEDLRDQQNGKADAAVAAHKMTEPEEQAALALLRDPHLLGRILEDFERCGVVGETDNKLLGYLAAVSRKLPRPLGVIVQSSSAAGKSSLLDAILNFVPEEDRLSFSAMTGQSLFYMGSADLGHKIVAVAEHQGAARAAYALKLLQSEGRLVIASTGKAPTTGRLTSHEYRVEGPVALFMTTTGDVDEELLNRCLILAVDEGAEQTRAIHARQRRAQTLEDLFAREERQQVAQLHRNAQRLLRPLHVVNPFATELPFAGCRVRSRRDHPKYLALIASLALLHQYQRPVKTAERGGRSIQYVEVTRQDIATADRLAHSVLVPDADDLPPITQRLLGQLDALVGETARQNGIARSQVRFTRREARERLGMGGTQLWHHLRRLVDAEYVVAHPSRHGRGTVYELAYTATNGSVRGHEKDRSGNVRHGFGDRSGQARSAEEGESPNESHVPLAKVGSDAANAHSADRMNAASYACLSSNSRR